MTCPKGVNDCPYSKNCLVKNYYNELTRLCNTLNEFILCSYDIDQIYKSLNRSGISVPDCVIIIRENESKVHVIAIESKTGQGGEIEQAKKFLEAFVQDFQLREKILEKASVSANANIRYRVAVPHYEKAVSRRSPRVNVRGLFITLEPVRCRNGLSLLKEALSELLIMSR